MVQKLFRREGCCFSSSRRRYGRYFEALEERTLFSFGVTTGTNSSPSLNTLVIDNGGEIVFSVATGGSGISSTVHVGDVTSIKYKGQEMLASYGTTSRFSHYEQGLGSITNVSYKVDSVNGWILVTCDDSAETSGAVIQYYAVRKNDSNIYMASLPIDVNNGPGEGRFIAYLNRSVFSNPEAPSDNAGNTGAIEGSDVFGHADGTTTSKFYNMGRRMIENVYHGLTGTAGGTSVGAWMFMGNREHSAGGPFFKDIDFQSGSAVEIYNCVFTGHTQTEAYRQGLQGPYALQFTNGALPAAVDYSWLENLKAADGTLLIKGLIPAAQRGALTGHTSGVTAGHETVVGLANATAQYWAFADGSGNYTIPGIQAGTYTMTLYDNELEVGTKAVTVVARATSYADIVSTYITPSAANTVFRIGMWDGTPLGFLNSDKIEIMHPSDVRMTSWTSTPNFVVGTNTDAQWPMVQFMGVNNSQRITFTLTAAQVQNLTLRIGITLGFEGGRNRVTVNAGQSYAWTSAIPAASRDLNSRGITRGTWRGQNQLYTYSIPASALRAGTNTIDLPVVSGSYVSGQTWLSPNVAYDAIDLVTASSLTNAPRVASVSIVPVNPSTVGYGTLTFAGTARDQFGNVTPANFTYAAARGVIDGIGRYTAPRTAGSDTVTITSGTLSASTTVNITASAPNAAPTVAMAAAATPGTRFGPGPVALSVLGADDDGEAGLTYTWAAINNSPAGVTFSANATNAAKNTTATFATDGTYTLQVTIKDAFGATVTSQVTVTVLRDQVLRYQANAASGTTLADSSGSNLTGTLTGSYAWAAGVSGNAIKLTGGYTAVPTGFLSNVNDFTIATWVRVDTLSTWSRIFDFGTGTNTYMFLTPRATGVGGPLRFAITNSAGAGEQQLNGPVLAAGVWYHVAVVLSGTTGTLYVNGAAVATNTAMTLKPSSLGNTNQNYLGKSQYAADPAFLGSLDDFRVFGRALGASEVLALSTPMVAMPAVPAMPTVTANSVGLSVLGADETSGEAGLTYTWATTGTPPAGVAFSVNGTNGAKSTVATFTKPGTYDFVVTITNSAGRSVTSTTSVTVGTAVAGRYLFYRGSAFDTTDDAAIATDKQALLPEATATFVNYSSYDRGINGLMIDIAGPVGSLTATDFAFKAGNTMDASEWADAAVPASVTVRTGAGANGANRVEITWTDGAIVNAWLQVTLKANGVSNLAADDVFYFGNAIGESGNSASDAAVTSADVLAARGHISTDVAAIGSAWDYNRDGVVSAADMAVAQGHLTAGDAVLILLAAPAVAPAGVIVFRQDAVTLEAAAVAPDPVTRTTAGKTTVSEAASPVVAPVMMSTNEVTTTRTVPPGLGKKGISLDLLKPGLGTVLGKLLGKA